MTVWTAVTRVIRGLVRGLVDALLNEPQRPHLDIDVPTARRAAVAGATLAARYVSFDAAWLDYQATRVNDSDFDDFDTDFADLGRSKTVSRISIEQVYFREAFVGGRNLIKRFERAGVPWQDALTAMVAHIEKASTSRDVFVESGGFRRSKITRRP